MSAFEIDACGRVLPGARGLSDAQASALDLARHVIVLAGAGSGKTRTLARRVVRILGSFAWEAATRGEGPGPEAVLVTTFTERAATELRERIRGELRNALRALQAGELDPAVQAALPAAARARYERHLRQCKDELDHARIGTTHAVCAGLLREHAAHLGIDPGFAVLEGRELRDLRTAAVATAMARLDASKEPDAGLLALGRGQWSEVLTTFLDRRHDLRAFRRDVDEPDALARLVLRWARPDPDRLLAALGPGSVAGAALSDLLVLGTTSAGGPPPFDAPLRALDAVLSLLASPSSRPDAFVAVESALAGLCTSAGTWRAPHPTWLGRKDLWPDAATRGRVQAAWTTLRAELATLFGADARALATLPAAVDPASIPVLRRAGALAREAIEAFDRAKTLRGGLDFSDLEVLTARLLGLDPEAVSAPVGGASAGPPPSLRGRFRHVLVDEFQDTNATQWAIVRALLGDPLPDAGLFLVGDPKQAIYRFRGGDVSLFGRAEAELVPMGARVVPFRGNYRTGGALLTPINDLFRWLLPSPDRRAPWEAAFEELDPQRGAGIGTLHLLEAVATPDLPPGGEAGGMADGSAESAEDDEAIDPLLAEAARVAKTARELVDAGHRRPASVAVLFGRRKWMDVYAAAMRDAGVPFAVAGGRGFWMRQEVQDLANLLLALTQPDDAVSLVGALRGPYLLLEDAALLWLVEQRREGSRSLRVAWDALVHGELVDELAVLPAGLSSALERAAASARRWLRAREEMPLSRLLRLILVDTRATFRFAVLDPTGQMAANVEKVVALAVAEDARGALAALAFARSLREEADLATDEAEATLDASAPVILMTVHQSKGLEFPWVLLPDLRARILHQERGVCTVARLDPDDPTRWDLGLRLAVPTEEGWERRPTLVHRAATRQSALEERAEAARLFYVACTRAEDGLVLFLGPDGGVEPPELARARHAEDWVRGWQAEAGWQEQPWVQAASTAAPPPPAMPVVEPGLLAPIQVPGTVLLHPTDLVRGTLQHRRGPAQPPSAAAARLRGTIVHAAIEDGGDLDADAVARRCRAALLTRGLGDDVHHLWLTAEVRRHLDGYRRAAPVALLGSAPGARALREVAFRLALPRDWAPPQERWVLDGVADLLWRDEEARTWVVLDHKTDEADPDDLAAHYRPQLVGYAWAMARILPEVRDEGWSLRAEVLSTAAGRRVVALPRCSPRDVEGELRGLVGRWAGARGGP